MRAKSSDGSAQWLLSAAVFTASMGYAAVLPVLQSVLLRSGVAVTRASVSTHTALLTGVYMLAFAVFSPVWGRGADAWGRRPAVLGSMAGFAVTSAAFAVPSEMLVTYVLRGLNGAFAAGALPAALAHISDTREGADRAGGVGRITAAATLGFLAGPALSGWFAGIGSALPGVSRSAQIVAVPFFVIAVQSLAVLAACYLLLPESLENRRAIGSLSVSPTRTTETSNGSSLAHFSRLLALTALGTFALGGFEVGSVLRGQEVLGFGPQQIALVFVECSVVMLAVQAGLVGPALRQAGPRRAVVLALVLAAVGFVLLSFVLQYAAFILTGGMVATGTGLLVPVVAYWAASGAGRLRGTVLGWQSAAAGLGQALGSSVFGLLFGLSAFAPFWLTASLLVIGIMLPPRRLP